ERANAWPSSNLVRWQVGKPGRVRACNASECFPARGLPHSGSKGLSQPDPDGPSTPSELPHACTRSVAIMRDNATAPGGAGINATLRAPRSVEHRRLDAEHLVQLGA